MTKLHMLNYYILQWLFLRLARRCDNGKQVGWTLLVGMVPMTGWECPYKWIP